MSSTSGDGKAREDAREALVADMKARFEKGLATGLSPEQVRETIAQHAREEVRRQAPQVVARARSWWLGFRNFLAVGALAAGLAIGLALLIEHRYASPLCEQHGARQGLAYRGLDYPVIGRSSSTTSSSGSCMFVDGAGHRSTVRLDKLEANAAIVLLVSLALQIEFTIPAFFVLLALLAVGFGRLRR
jgi:hypothetical protein